MVRPCPSSRRRTRDRCRCCRSRSFGPATRYRETTGRRPPARPRGAAEGRFCVAAKGRGCLSACLAVDRGCLRPRVARQSGTGVAIVNAVNLKAKAKEIRVRGDGCELVDRHRVGEAKHATDRRDRLVAEGQQDCRGLLPAGIVGSHPGSEATGRRSVALAYSRHGLSLGEHKHATCLST